MPEFDEPMEMLVRRENDWYPGKPPSKEEVYEAENRRLLKRIEELEHAAYLQSWKDNPDRMGGSFSQYEIDRARNGYWT
jgi:hypothetical protein